MRGKCPAPLPDIFLDIALLFIVNLHSSIRPAMPSNYEQSWDGKPRVHRGQDDLARGGAMRAFMATR